MRLERSKNAKRNGVWGIISNFISIFLPFIVRTVLIKELGAEYLGLSSLFTSVLTVLNITELGFGTAIVYSMYKPLAEDDTDTICCMLNYFKLIYRAIGSIILVVSLLLLPFLRFFIKGDVPSDINIYYLYILYLSNTVVSYWLFAYRSSILTIYQRNDIKSKVIIVLSSAMYMAQIILLTVTKNYYLYVAILFVYTILNNLIPAIIIRKLYPQYICRGKISKAQRIDIRTRVLGLMITKVSAISRNAFDSIIVSAFLGLEIVAIYNNYYYIINALTGIMSVLTSAIAAGVGNSVATDSAKKNLEDMEIINFLYMWIAGWFMVCLSCLYQPFMKLWVGEELMFSNPIMWLFALYFLLLKVGDIQAQYFDATGLWWHRRWYSICEAVANIILNFVLGYYFGVGGVVCATIITVFFINFCGSSRIIFREYFKMGLIKYMCSQLMYIGTSTVICFVTMIICRIVPAGQSTYGLCIELLLRMIICVLVPNILFFIIYCKTSICKNSLNWLKRRMK